MTEQESIQTRLEKMLKPVSIRLKREILWELLRGVVTEDEEGVRWLHGMLDAFIKDEFDDV
jgi:hypothetical protein